MEFNIANVFVSFAVVDMLFSVILYFFSRKKKISKRDLITWCLLDTALIIIVLVVHFVFIRGLGR